MQRVSSLCSVISRDWKLRLPVLEKMAEVCWPSTRLSVIQAQRRGYEIQLKWAREETYKAGGVFLGCKETVRTLECLYERLNVEEAKESASSWYSITK